MFDPYTIFSLIFIVILALSVYYSLFISRIGALKLPKILPYADLQKIFGHKVAIVIPTRNEEENITTVLSSMMNQSFKHFTVVVTDRSSDNTLGVAKKFYEDNKSIFTDKDINLILLAWDESKNFRKGRIGQFNHAFSILPPTIEYIGYADADGEYHTDWLFCLAYGINQGSDLVSSGFILSKKHSIADHMDNLDNQFVVISGQSSLRSGIRGWMFGASVLYRRAVFNEIKGYDGIEHIIMDDFSLANKFFMHNKKINYFNDRRTIVKVAPVPNPVKQKIRWSSANWAKSDKKSTLVTLSINLFPLVFYLIALLSALVLNAKLINNSFFENYILIGLLMFIVDLSVVIYLCIVTKVNVIWIPFYLFWINLLARPIVLYSFFKRQVKWKDEKVVTNKVNV